jgi:hypothetical protein
MRYAMLLFLAAIPSIAGGQEPAPTPANSQLMKEIAESAEAYSSKYSNIAFSCIQTYSSSRSEKCRLFIGPDYVFAESDQWVFCLTNNESFTIGKTAKGNSLLATYSREHGSSNDEQFRAFKNSIGGSASAFIPIPRRGVLANTPSSFGEDLPTTLRSPYIKVDSFDELPNDLLRMRYHTILPKDLKAENLRGRPVQLEGHMILDKKNGYLVTEAEKHSMDNASKTVSVKDKYRYSRALQGCEAMFLMEFEQSTKTRNTSKGTSQVKISYSDFKPEEIDRSKLTLAHYGLTFKHSKGPSNRIAYIVLFGLFAGCVLAFFYLRNRNSQQAKT